MKRFLLLCLLVLTTAADGLAETFICKVAKGVSIERVAASINATVVDSLDEPGMYLLSAPTVPTVAPRGVEFIEVRVQASIPKQVFSIFSKTTTIGTLQWYQDQPAMRLVNLPAALAVSQGRGVVIADLNSAVDYGHPSLIGHLIAGRDFVNTNTSSGGRLDQAAGSFLDQAAGSFLDQAAGSFLDQAAGSFLDQAAASFLDQAAASFLDASNPAHGHGTLVAGIIAAMAPQAMIMPLRVFDDNGHADSNKIVRAIHYAVKNGAKIINMSFGLTEPSKAVDSAIEYALQHGVIVIASAGNSNSNVPQYPASQAGVIGVAATTIQDQKAGFSNYGEAVDVDAPGMNVISAYPGGYFAMVSGTSFAAPMVAAEAAILLSHRMTAGDSIKAGVVNIDALNPTYAGQLGAGRIDLLKALLSN